jgi:PAS domain S-box-containing protein
MSKEVPIQKQVEAALRKSELRFRTLVRAVSAITWSCPSSGLHVEPQPEWMAFTGQTAEEMLGDGWNRAVHPEDRAATASAWQQAVARGEPYAGEVRIRRHDGEWRWMSVRAAPIRDASGEIVEWFGMNIDITEQKNAANALRESEERFRLLMDNSPTFAWVKDEEGRYVYLSRTYERRFGMQAADWLEKTAAELWPPKLAAAFQKSDLAVLTAGHPIEVVEEMRNADGSKFIGLATKFPFRDARGKQYVGGIGLDITERKQMEAALRASERRFRAIFNNQFLYAALLSPEGRIVEISESVVRGTGVAADEVIGELFLDGPWWKDLPEMRARWRRQFEEALTRPGPSQDEADYRTKDGELRYALNSVTALRDEQGELEFFLCEGVDITERKRAENALRESEERLRQVSNNADVGLTRCSRDWIYLSANPAYAKIVGKPLDQIVDRPIAEVMGVEAAETIRPFVERVLRGERVTFEAEVPFDGAGLRYLDVSYTPDADAEGRIVGWIACITDITERRQAENALRASERRFRATFRHQLAYSALLSPEGRLIEASDVALRATGVALEEIIGLLFLDGPWWRDLPEVRARWRRQFEEALAQPGPSRDEVEYRTGDGALRYALNSVTALRDEQGELEYFLCEGLDITERKRTEDALRESEERLRLALDASRAGSWAWDIVRNVATWDDRYHALYELPPGAPRSFETWIERLHPEDRARILSRIEQVRAAPGDDHLDEDYRSVSPEGRVRWHQGLGRAQRDAAGKLVKLVGIDLDITERKQAEEELRGADRRKDDFLATLAHELRSPLAPVRNGLDALRRLGAQDPSADRLLVMMEGQVDHLVRLVDDLMDISRISRGKFELQKQRSDLAAALGQAVNMSRHLFEGEGLDLRLNLSCKPTPIDGDVVRLTQVFANLLSNAARHTKRGGSIHVTLERVGDEAVVSVADTGAGISKELLPHIFDPFVQGGGKGGRSEQGLGIGLALVREITQMHGGTVEARSDGEGLGSTFIVRLPLLEAEMIEPPASRSVPARLETAPRVLVIDDMPKVAEALAFLLNVLGADVRVAYSGAQGLEVCAEFEPELVLLDLSMPKMDGFETARRMREFPAGRRARLVAVTGLGEEQSRMRAKEAGFESHLVKPARLKQLEELLASVSARTAQATAAD